MNKVLDNAKEAAILIFGIPALIIGAALFLLFWSAVFALGNFLIVQFLEWLTGHP